MFYSTKSVITILIFYLLNIQVSTLSMHLESDSKKNAYATILYPGTIHDYEFYIATRVLFQSLIKLKTNADLIVIASQTMPQNWIETL